MGEFQNGQFVTGAALADDGRAGTPAGVHARDREPMARRELHDLARQLVPPAGPRDGDPPPSRFDAWGSKAERRDLTRAAEFVGSMDGDQAQQYREWLAGEQAELDSAVGEAESGHEEQTERIALTNMLADDVKATADELVAEQREFLIWAADEFGSQDELLRWLGEQKHTQDALRELAEEYLAGSREDDGPT